MPVQKISVSLEKDLAEWLSQHAAAKETSVSSVVADAVIAFRQHEARLQVLDYLGGPASDREVADEENRILAAIRERATSARSHRGARKRRAAKRRSPEMEPSSRRTSAASRKARGEALVRKSPRKSAR